MKAAFNLRKLTATALCLALGMVLPSLFHMLGAGQVFLPMHIPVLLCGLLCGWPYGAFCGLVLPLLSSLTGMPPLYPTAIAMMFELCAYGAFTGLFHKKLRWNVYPAMVLAMLIGRAVSGCANAILLGVGGILQPSASALLHNASTLAISLESMRDLL